MSKYLFLKEQLETVGEGNMTCFGNSMLPILKSGSKCTFKKQESYKVGDIVFCKVKGRWIDAHKIIKIDQNKGYLIANNHGYENGWTTQVFGRVIKAEHGQNVKEF